MSAREEQALREQVARWQEKAREELAAVLYSARWPDGDTTGFPTKRVAEMLADALLTSPALADLIREKQAEALREAAGDVFDTAIPAEVARWLEDRADQVEGGA